MAVGSEATINAQGVSAGRDATLVAGNLIIQAASISGVCSLHQLPPPPADFTGREEELDELERLLTSAPTAGAAISGKHAGVQGMGGVGKSAFALVLAHRLKDRYPDAQLFLNLRGADPERRPPVAPVEAMRDIILAFRPTASLPAEVDALARTYYSVLTEAGRVLLVLDNAADAAQVRPLLPPPGCLLLVTSRAQWTLPGLTPRRLDCLPPGESCKLLLRLAPRLDGHADAAATLCGHLPLALEVFAGSVNDRALYPVPDLLDRLRERVDRLTPVDAAFELGWDLLPEATRHRWALLSVFPASFDSRAAATVWEESPEDARSTLQVLFNANLVEWDRTANRFRLHDLVRQYVEGKLDGAARDAARFRHAVHYRDVGREADELYLRGGDHVVPGLELFDRERTHLEAAFSYLREARTDRDSATLLLALVDAVGHTSSLRFHPRQRIRWLEAQRDAAREVGDRQGEGMALNNLGNAWLDLGEARRAIGYHEQALAIAREVGDRSGEGAALNNLGNAWLELGELRRAIDHYDQQLAIAREVGDRSGEGMALGNLGVAWLALGEPRRAIDHHEQALAIAREVGDRRREGAALNNLGNAWLELGELRRAIDHYDQQLAIAREVGDRRREGIALGNLGNAWLALGEPRRAIGYHEQALAIAREVGDRSGEGAALNNLGNAWLALGEPRRAIGYHEQALAIAREVGDRRREGSALNNLGSAWLALGEPRRAIGYHEQALAIAREVGDRHGEGSALGNLGGAYLISGEARRAIGYCEQQLAIAREVGDRSGEGTALWNSALSHDVLGNRAEAIDRAQSALTVYETVEDPRRHKVRARLEEWRNP